MGDARCRSGRRNPARPSWAGVWGLWRGALAMMVVMILPGFSWAASIPGEGTSPSSPGCLRALCHSSTGGDEAKEQVVFELCVTAALNLQEVVVSCAEKEEVFLWASFLFH